MMPKKGKIKCYFCVILLLAVSHAFPNGPPYTPLVCKEMFPIGHGFDAKTSKPPYTIEVSANVYKPWNTFIVTVQATDGYFMDGLFVQARRANCRHPYKDDPVGTFKLKEGDPYLKTMPCGNRLNSSIGHRINDHLGKAVFFWIAPAEPMGHLYIRATVVKDRATFWTDVFSEIIRDLSSSSKYREYCPTRKYLDPSERNRSTTRSTMNTWPPTRSPPITFPPRSGGSSLYLQQSLFVVFMCVFLYRTVNCCSQR